MFFQIPYAIIALLVLSIVWSPKLRKLQIETNSQDSSQSDDENASEDVANAAKITARGKAAIVISLWKLFLTPFVALVFAKICNIVELGGMSEEWVYEPTAYRYLQQVDYDPTVFWEFL